MPEQPQYSIYRFLTLYLFLPSGAAGTGVVVACVCTSTCFGSALLKCCAFVGFGCSGQYSVNIQRCGHLSEASSNNQYGCGLAPSCGHRSHAAGGNWVRLGLQSYRSYTSKLPCTQWQACGASCRRWEDTHDWSDDKQQLGL